MELADFYFRRRDMPLAADAYDLFVQNYPRSRQVVKARLRLIYSTYAPTTTMSSTTIPTRS